MSKKRGGNNKARQPEVRPPLEPYQDEDRIKPAKRKGKGKAACVSRAASVPARINCSYSSDATAATTMTSRGRSNVIGTGAVRPRLQVLVAAGDSNVQPRSILIPHMEEIRDAHDWEHYMRAKQAKKNKHVRFNDKIDIIVI
jgi:hypothetical protein